MGTRALNRHGNAAPATIALCKQQNNTTQPNDYWQWNSENGDALHSTGTLAGTLILARNQGIHGKQAIYPACLANWHDTPGQDIECTCKLTATKAIKTNNSMAITC